MKHVTVLKTEAIEALGITPKSVVVDATFGSGGHARGILEILEEGGVYIGIDADKEAFRKVHELQNLSKARSHFVTENFRKLSSILAELHITHVDAVLADLGWRTEQFTEGTKGFSFHDDSGLSMTFGDAEQYTFTAYDIVNEWDEENIADVLYGYGDEHHSRRIAHAIATARLKEPITTAAKLAQIIADAIPKKFQKKRIHPATKSFQALRIAVNDELGALKELIAVGVEHLSKGGRMGIITFHSIEDRLVKELFRAYAHDEVVAKVTKKPLIPTREEVQQNPRARSAKLRVIEKR